MAGFLILPLLLHCLWWSGCGAVWRYRTNTGTYLIFSTRTTIYLEYEGTAFSRWDVPSLCTIDDATKKETTLFCPVPGTHRIQPIVTVISPDDEERYLPVHENVNCFMWYIHQNETRLLDTNPTQLIKVWLFDPENAKMTEKLNTATSPPLGMAVEEKRDNLSLTECILGPLAASSGIWDKYLLLEHYLEEWNILVNRIIMEYGQLNYLAKQMTTWQPSLAKQLLFRIVLFLILLLVLPQPLYKLGLETGVSVTLPRGSETIISWAACYPESAVVVTDVGIFHTSNGFLTTAEIKFPVGLIDPSMIHSIKEVAIVFPNVFILIQNILYEASVGTITNVGDNYFHRVDIIGIRAKTWCSGKYPLVERRLSEIIIWSEEDIFLGYSEDEFSLLTNTEQLRRELSLEITVNLLIVSACYDSRTATVAVLLECTGCFSQKILYMAAYNEDTAQWILKDFILGLPTAGAIHMEAILSALSSMVLWDNDTVFYTYDKNSQYGYLEISGTKEKFSAVSEGSTIHQMIIDYSGNAIIKLKNNALFFFKFQTTDVVKLTAWENNLTRFIFYFNPSGDMYLLTINNTNINRKVYPLNLEVLSAASKLNEVCPYISFEHNLNLDIHYIDRRENVTFWGQIVFLENLGLSTDVKIYRPELLLTEIHINYEIARGICTKNKTVTFYEARDTSLYDYQEELAVSQGIMTVEFQPSQSGKTCVSNRKLSHISIGCPPGKKIIVAKKPPSCENFNFTIPRMHLRNKRHKGNLVVRFDIEKYGCPLEIHYTEVFRPEVQLYKDDKTLIPVEANYVLWEMNERTDFTYVATMEQVGCSYTAQSWNEMIEIYDKTMETVENIDNVWGPHNYRPCFFEGETELGKLNKPYEILNRSGLNFIAWPPYTSTFMFKLIILDPDFSFCNLSTYFAVQIQGIIQRPHWMMVAGWVTMVVTIFWGFLIFSYFRYVKIFRSLPFIAPLQSLSPNVHEAKPDDELKKD